MTKKLFWEEDFSDVTPAQDCFILYHGDCSLAEVYIYGFPQILEPAALEVPKITQMILEKWAECEQIRKTRSEVKK